MNIHINQLADRTPLMDMAEEKTTEICSAISDRIELAYSNGDMYIDYEIKISDNTRGIRGMQQMVTSFVIAKVEHNGFTVKKISGEKNIWRISGWCGFTDEQLKTARKYIDQHE